MDDQEHPLAEDALSPDVEQALLDIFPDPAGGQADSPAEPKGQANATIRPAAFQPFVGGSPRSVEPGNMELLMDVSLPLSVQLGTAVMTVRDILALGPGSVVELSKAAGEPVGLFANNKLIAHGEVVVVDENFGIRIVEIVSRSGEDSR